METKTSMTSGPEDPHIDGRKVGQIAHQVIADLAQGGCWDAATILSCAGAHPALAKIGTYRQAARQRLATLAAVYGRLFHPGPSVELEGVEVRVPGGRLDLLWHDRSRGVRWADEIKTHTLPELLSDERLTDQLGRQAQGAATRYESFLGVRACLLTSPRKSVLWRPDGECEDAFTAMEGFFS